MTTFCDQQQVPERSWNLSAQLLKDNADDRQNATVRKPLSDLTGKSAESLAQEFFEQAQSGESGN